MSYLKENLAGVVIAAVLSAVAIIAFLTMVAQSKVIGLKGQADTIISQVETYVGTGPIPGTYDSIELSSIGFDKLPTTDPGDGTMFIADDTEYEYGQAVIVDTAGVSDLNVKDSSGKVTAYNNIEFVNPATTQIVNTINVGTKETAASTDTVRLGMTEGSMKGLFVQVFEGDGTNGADDNQAIIRYSVSPDAGYDKDVVAKFEGQFKTTNYQTVYTGLNPSDGIFTVVKTK